MRVALCAVIALAFAAFGAGGDAIASTTSAAAPSAMTFHAPAGSVVPTPTPKTPARPAVATPVGFDPAQFPPLTSATLPLENGKRIAMRVNALPITWDDFITQVRLAGSAQYQQFPAAEARIAAALQQAVKEGLVLTGLYRGFAAKHHLAPEAREVERAKGAVMTARTMRANPGMRLLSPDQIAQIASDSLTREKVNRYIGDLATSAPPTQTELAHFVETRRPTTSPAIILRAQHIVIRAAAQMTPFQRQDARARAEEILGRLEGAPTTAPLTGADKLPFPVAARQFSQDRLTAYLGGDLGYFRDGTMYDAVNAALETLQPGEVSTVIETPVGFHIFQLTERHEDGDLRLQYDGWRRDEAVRKWKEAAERSAKVESYLGGP